VIGDMDVAVGYEEQCSVKHGRTFYLTKDFCHSYGIYSSSFKSEITSMQMNINFQSKIKLYILFNNRHHFIDDSQVTY